MKPFFSALLFVAVLLLLAAPSEALEISGHVEAEGRLFFNEPLYTDQEHHNGSIALAPEFYHEFSSGTGLTFVPFLRLDSADSERTHFDIRELNLLFVGDPWELRFGIGKVFWGATEFVHLVDIINQTDLVENIDGEDKLGQPMAQLSAPTDWGLFDVFVLPYFRERTFPGKKGRLRPSLVVDTDNPVYEDDDEENHVDFALRYSRVLASGDIGFYFFKGTGRTPFLISETVNNETSLLPYYPQIEQTGLDLQLVAGNWLWKLESLYQDNVEEPFFAATGGLEYTFIGLGGSMADLGVVVEYAYDDRDGETASSFNNDLLLGLRLGVNDSAGTELLLGFGHDLDARGNLLQLEASRRLTDHLKIFLEGWLFFDTDPADFTLYAIRRDDFIRLLLFYYF